MTICDCLATRSVYLIVLARCCKSPQVNKLWILTIWAIVILSSPFLCFEERHKLPILLKSLKCFCTFILVCESAGR